MSDFPAEGLSVRPLDAARVVVQGRSWQVHAFRQDHQLSLQLGPWSAEFNLSQAGAASVAGPAGDAIVSPMPGRVVAVNCAPGDKVCAGQALIVVEAMKMEQELSCERDGEVESITVQADDQIAQGQELLRLVAEDETP